MIPADKLRAWVDVLDAVETPLNLHDTEARKTIDALEAVAAEIHEEYLAAVAREARSA